MPARAFRLSFGLGSVLLGIAGGTFDPERSGNPSHRFGGFGAKKRKRITTIATITPAISNTMMVERSIGHGPQLDQLSL